MMMSIVPAFSFTEPALVNQLPDFQTGFTPWDLDCSDLFSVIKSTLEPVIPSPCTDQSKTGSVTINTGFHDTKSGSNEFRIVSIKTSSGSDDSHCIHAVPSPQSDESDSDHNRKMINRPVLHVSDECKRKRMESNRESAKRSRMRKQRHIENLRDKVNRLGLENRELRNRLRIVLYHLEHISTDNNQLLSEQEILRQRFLELRQILILRQLQNQQQWGQNSSLVIDHQML